MNFRTQIYLKKLFEECKGETSWTYGIYTFDVALQKLQNPSKKTNAANSAF